MTPGIGMYNFNMTGSSWTGLFQQGMGMLGGGFGGFGGCGIFTNCFGEVNYDAMAGYGVANALMGVAGQAISSAVSQKREAKAEQENNKAEIEKIDNQITEKTGEKSTLSDEIKTKQDEISTASKTITSLKSQITDLNVAAEKDAYEKAKAQDPQPANLDDLKQAYDDAVEKEADLNKQIKEQEEIINAANEKIQSNQTAIEKLNEEIRNLEARKEKLQKSVNDFDLDKADGKKFQRTKKEDFDAKWNADGSMADNVEFTKGDMRYAIAGFRNATTNEDKKYWANKIATIYKNMNQSDITSDFKAARKIVDSYVD